MTLTDSEKARILARFTEDQLRERVIIPLLSKLGYVDPIDHHHSGEKGKDIVCKELDSKLNKVRYIAVVVKSGDITGSSSGSNGFFAVINQVKQVFNEAFKDIYALREVHIDKCLIVTSGEVLPTALESISGTLRTERLDKLIDIIDGKKLISFIDTWFEEFWSEEANEKAALLTARNMLLNNLSKLLSILVKDEKQRALALKDLSAKEIHTVHNYEFYRFVADVGYATIEIDEIAPQFTEVDYPLCPIINHFVELKKAIRSLLREMGEPIDLLKQMLQETNPETLVELVREFERNNIVRPDRLSFNASDVLVFDNIAVDIGLYGELRAALRKHDCVQFYRTQLLQMEDKLKKSVPGWSSIQEEGASRTRLTYCVKLIPENKVIQSHRVEISGIPDSAVPPESFPICQFESDKSKPVWQMDIWLDAEKRRFKSESPLSSQNIIDRFKIGFTHCLLTMLTSP